MKLASLALTLVGAASAMANPFVAESPNTAQAAYVSTLMRGAVATANSQLRRLDAEAAAAEPDLSGYVVKFGKCQFVKSYSDDMAEADTDTVLATSSFVVFRLCPSASCSSCNSKFGEYIVDLATYLTATVTFQQTAQTNMCTACDECAATDDAAAAADGGRKLAVDCTTCATECSKIANMQANGYIDAVNFLGCEMIFDDGTTTLYAAPVCASYGTKIKIGVFTDNTCYTQDTSKSVDDYLVDADGYQMKLSHALLRTVYETSTTCMSCVNADDGSVDDMCTTIYDSAGKCESSHGFANSYANIDGYANQASQETVVCNFIKSLSTGTYDEQGEIVIGGSSSKTSGGTKTSGGQKFALTFFIFGTVALGVYAGLLHSKLTKGRGADLSRQTGSMA